jgi:hypothetical protein
MAPALPHKLHKQQAGCAVRCCSYTVCLHGRKQLLVHLDAVGTIVQVAICWSLQPRSRYWQEAEHKEQCSR